MVSSSFSRSRAWAEGATPLYSDARLTNWAGVGELHLRLDGHLLHGKKRSLPPLDIEPEVKQGD